jgi:hypothetical protein
MTDLCATFAPFCSIRAKTRCGSSSYAERAGRPLLMPKSQVVVLQFFYARPDAPRWTTPTPPPTLSPTVPSAARRRRLPRLTSSMVMLWPAIGRRRRWRRRTRSRTSPSRIAIDPGRDRSFAIGRRRWWQGRSWSRASPSRMAIPVETKAPRRLSRPITPRGLPRRRRPDRPQPSPPPAPAGRRASARIPTVARTTRTQG